jgi:hypothetical protein
MLPKLARESVETELDMQLFSERELQEKAELEILKLERMNAVDEARITLKNLTKEC